ncbi:hypothetical protein SAMN04489713_105393 [Actinomadura madurae]|uniref:Uncharacterized protein n=1 Tax=Actinomadura madurae TaxID=1993 RepID=A0A1I5GTB5_9ACTN|nr:hypothetical protein [Actinomadura madurae]SFO39179.1 hypothetical protein SAMN04489713_105393 [Actinomadura madurae]
MKGSASRRRLLAVHGTAAGPTGLGRFPDGQSGVTRQDADPGPGVTPPDLVPETRGPDQGGLPSDTVATHA